MNLRNTLFFFSLFLVSYFTCAMEDPDPSEDQPESCLEIYKTRLNESLILKFSEKRRNSVKDTIKLFRRLEHRKTTYKKIAKVHYDWWIKSSFSRWPFYKLLAIYRSGVLCEKDNRLRSVDWIILNFDKLAKLPKVSLITSEIELLKQYKKQKIAAKKKEKSDHRIRKKLVENHKEKRDFYDMYASDTPTEAGLDVQGESDAENVESECSVCMTDAKNITLRCGHSFCKECIASHIGVKISEKNSKIKCLAPGCREDLVFMSKSDFELSFEQERDLIKNILDTEIASNKARSMRCSNEKCPFVFFCEKRIKATKKTKYKKCPKCSGKTCANCREQYNENHICPESLLKQQEEERKIRLEGKFMDCPFCGAWAEKTEGCARVRCANCKNYFDFATGGPWNQASENRQRSAAHGRGFHKAESQTKPVIKAESDFVDGNQQW